jgi:hypothetical protein
LFESTSTFVNFFIFFSFFVLYTFLEFSIKFVDRLLHYLTYYHSVKLVGWGIILPATTSAYTGQANESVRNDIFDCSPGTQVFDLSKVVRPLDRKKIFSFVMTYVSERGSNHSAILIQSM